LIIFLKKLLFLAFGAPSPPNTPADSIGSMDQSAVGVSSGPVSEAWLGWKLGPEPEVSLRIMLRALELTSGVDLVSCIVIGRRFWLPSPNFLRARLPALVALNPPAECPDMMLLLVSCVLLLLCVAYEDSVEFVALVFVVEVRPSS
jgi:hypothetical protein